MQLHRFTRTLRLFADDLSGDRLAAACASRVHSTHMSAAFDAVIADENLTNLRVRLCHLQRDSNQIF
jgi:hypothetical protein